MSSREEPKPSTTTATTTTTTAPIEIKEKQPQIVVALARAGIESYVMMFWKWVGGMDKLGNDIVEEELHSASASVLNSPSEMWNQFDNGTMQYLCGGFEKYIHADHLFRALYTWWSPHGPQIKTEKIGHPGDPYQIGQCREHVTWLFGMNKDSFKASVKWANDRHAEWNSRGLTMADVSIKINTDCKEDQVNE